MPILFAAEVLVGSLARFNPYHLDRSCCCVIDSWNKDRGVLEMLFTFNTVDYACVSRCKQAPEFIVNLSCSL
jgi:hypothetical protein